MVMAVAMTAMVLVRVAVIGVSVVPVFAVRVLMFVPAIVVRSMVLVVIRVGSVRMEQVAGHGAQDACCGEEGKQLVCRNFPLGAEGGGVEHDPFGLDAGRKSAEGSERGRFSA